LRIHLAALAKPSKSVWQTMVSITHTRATSYSVIISGHAPCSAFVESTKRGSLA
jgi:hypothetical protein